jgi:heme/copper-type cytochrome/quinol oxidase subunit 3
LSQAVATPHPEAHPTEQHAEMVETSTLGVGWGKLMMWLFLCSDAMSFMGLIASYFFLRFRDPTWPDPSEELGIWLTTFMTFVLICSSLTMVKSLSATVRGDREQMLKWLGLTVIGGAFFLGCQVYEWAHLFGLGHGIAKNQFDATFFTMTGFHGCHVLGGVIYLGILWLRAKKGPLPKPNTVEIAGLYWHFVDLVWILIFTFVYLITPPPGAGH